MAIQRCLLAFFVLVFAVSACEPDRAVQKQWPKSPMVSGAPKLSDSAVAAPETCNEEDGFRMVNGVCKDKEIKKAPAPPPVATECNYGDLKDCTLQCERGNSISCARLATMYTKGEGGARKNNAQAVPLFQKACDGGRLESCSILGMMLVQGEGVTKDFVKAAALFKKVCEAPQGGEVGAGGCMLLGMLYENGAGLTQDYAQAASLYQKSCDGSFYMACSKLGKLYELGKGVPKDAKKAMSLYKKACDANDKEGCAVLAHQKVVEQSKNWRVMRASEFIKYAEKIVNVLLARDPSLALAGFGVLPVMANPLLTTAQRESVMCEFYANTFFANDVVMVDDKFRVSPNFLTMYKNALPVLVKMKATCIQNCLASDVRATRDACDAICEKNYNL